MQLVSGSERIVAHVNCDPVRGAIRWAPAKSLWIGSMTIATLILGPLYFSWSAILVFIVSSGITLCAGHSVGMHRRLIHNGFECPLWLEYLCVYLGVLVAGFIVGGFFTALIREVVPDSVAKTVFTATWSPSIGPVSIDLLVINLTLGPLGLHVSFLALVGVLVAYLIARSLF